MPRVLTDLLAAEARRLRAPASLPIIGLPIIGLPITGVPITGEPIIGAWPAHTRLDEAGLGFDSLDRLNLAAALSEFLHLHEGGGQDHLLAQPIFGAWCGVARASLRRFSAVLTFRTSGSSGMPRSCPHALTALLGEIEAFRPLLPDRVGRVLAAVPCHHIYGFLFTVLLPWRLGVPVLDVRGLSPGGLIGAARPGDLVIGHPAFWGAVLRGAPAGWPPGVTGVTSTAPCPPELADGLIGAGLSRLLQIHGASETGGLGWRDDPHGAFHLLSAWERTDDDRLRRTAQAGGPSPPILLPDRLDWLDRRRYRLCGRRDGAVQIGGVNVFPGLVQRVLETHPEVAAASVRLMRPAEGVRLKAFIVPRHPDIDCHALLRNELCALATVSLSAPERPRWYTFGAALPVDPLGKASDWPIGNA